MFRRSVAPYFIHDTTSPNRDVYVIPNQLPSYMLCVHSEPHPTDSHEIIEHYATRAVPQTLLGSLLSDFNTGSAYLHYPQQKLVQRCPEHPDANLEYPCRHPCAISLPLSMLTNLRMTCRRSCCRIISKMARCVIADAMVTWTWEHCHRLMVFPTSLGYSAGTSQTSIIRAQAINSSRYHQLRGTPSAF